MQVALKQTNSNRLLKLLQSSIPYDLFTDFSGVPSQPVTFTNAQVLDTAAEGVTSGSLTDVDTSTGTVKATGDKLEIAGSGGINQTGVYHTDGVTKTLGKAAFFTLTANTAAACYIGLNESASILRNADPLFTLTAGKIQLRLTLTVVGTMVNGTSYQLMWLMGGYDTNGIPFKTGDTVADFTFGWTAFIKGGIYTTWTALWRSDTDNSGTLYQFFQGLTAPPVLSNAWRIPTDVLDVDIMFQPWFFDSFTGTGGDQLVSNHTPEIVDGETGTGNPWESGGTSWTIQGSEAKNDPTYETSIYDADKASFVLADMRGAELDSGSLALATMYEISAYTDQDFTADGASDNNVGTTFVARAQTVTLDSNNKVYPIDTGWAFSYVNSQAEIDTAQLKLSYVDNSYLAALYFRSTTCLDSAPVVGKIYEAQQDLKVSSGASLAIQYYDGASYYTDMAYPLNTTMTTLDFYVSAKAPTEVFAVVRSALAGDSVWFDNMSFQEVTLNELFAATDTGLTEGIFDVDVKNNTYSRGGVAGHVLCLDDIDNPSSFTQVYYNHGTEKIEVWKCVTGTYTLLVNESNTWHLGQLRVIPEYVSATNDVVLKIYYRNSLIGEQTIEDDEIAGNTIHGIMSSDPNSRLNNYGIIKRTDSSWDAEIAKTTGGNY